MSILKVLPYGSHDILLLGLNKILYKVLIKTLFYEFSDRMVISISSPTIRGGRCEFKVSAGV